MEKYFEINQEGHNIRCKLYYADLKTINKVVLYGHGFAGHKDNAKCEKFSERVLSKYKGIAVMIFNLPCHGDDVKKRISLTDCMAYHRIVIEYIKKEWNDPQIFSFATSFGGYLILRYIREFGNPFVKIALRCPAVNMYDILTKTIMQDQERTLIQKGKPVTVGFDRKITIDGQFLEELSENDIRKMEYLDFADDILILHGTKDEIVPYEEGKKFAEDNVIEFITVENADHRFLNPAHMEIVMKKVLEFFAFS